MSNLQVSWVESANSPDGNFPLNNLPYGIFSTATTSPSCGVAIGDYIFDVATLARDGFLEKTPVALLQEPTWNTFMAAGQAQWTAFRVEITQLLSANNTNHEKLEKYLVKQLDARLHLPLQVTEFTDFYASKNHATNVGTMFRGAENALPPNWLHMPIGYNGRASSVVVSGTEVTRPMGQVKSPDDINPTFKPSKKFDFELEIGAIVGVPSQGRVSVQDADQMIFGYVLLNDWSARDIQAWEYQPLGPFQAKATATTISPWIISPAALEPFRVNTPERETPLLPHIVDDGPMLYNIDLTVDLILSDKTTHRIVETNYRTMYYSSAQQLAHHTSSGCPMRAGDLLGSGTISGLEKDSRGSMLELSWNGQNPLDLSDSVQRSFLHDNDSVKISGHAQGEGYRIGFGPCEGTIVASEI